MIPSWRFGSAADFFIIPLTPDYLSLEGLANFVDAAEKIRSGIGGKVAAPMGILLTLADYRLNVTEEIGRMIRGHHSVTPGLQDGNQGQRPPEGIAILREVDLRL